MPSSTSQASDAAAIKPDRANATQRKPQKGGKAVKASASTQPIDALTAQQSSSTPKADSIKQSITADAALDPSSKPAKGKHPRKKKAAATNVAGAQPTSPTIQATSSVAATSASIPRVKLPVPKQPIPPPELVESMSSSGPVPLVPASIPLPRVSLPKYSNAGLPPKPVSKPIPPLQPSGSRTIMTSAASSGLPNANQLKESKPKKNDFLQVAGSSKVSKRHATNSSSGGEAAGNASKPQRVKKTAEQRAAERQERQQAREAFDRTSSTGSIERSEQMLNLMSSAGRDLSKQILALIEPQAPSEGLINARKGVIREMERALNSTNFWWGHPHSPKASPLQIIPFGSNAFGLSTSSSDLDLCILDPYRPFGWIEKWEHSKLPSLYNLHKLADVLRRWLRPQKIFVIRTAAVQIVKFEVERDGHVIQGDLNVNERLGILNSALIDAYCQTHPQVRPLAAFVKFWATQRALKDSSGRKGPRSFSSYTLTLMVIAYMQSKSLLPNLQDKDLLAREGVTRTAFFSTPKRYFDRSQLKWRPPVGWDTTFFDRPPPGFTPPDVDLEELVKGFFDWVSEFPFESRVVSIEQGGSFARQRAYDEHVIGNLADQIQKTRLERSKADEKRLKARQAEADLERADRSADGAAAMLALADLTDHSIGRDDSEDVELGDVSMNTDASNDDRLLHQLFPPTKTETTKALDTEIPAAATTKANSSNEISSPPADKKSNRREKEKGKRQEDDRPSTPQFEGDRFEEPIDWDQRIIVQDPFLRQRNTAKNVSSSVAAAFLDEIRRAAILLHAGEPVTTICERVSVADMKKRYAALDETIDGNQSSSSQKGTYGRGVGRARLSDDEDLDSLFDETD